MRLDPDVLVTLQACCARRMYQATIDIQTMADLPSSDDLINLNIHKTTPVHVANPCGRPDTCAMRYSGEDRTQVQLHCKLAGCAAAQY